MTDNFIRRAPCRLDGCLFISVAAMRDGSRSVATNSSRVLAASVLAAVVLVHALRVEQALIAERHALIYTSLPALSLMVAGEPEHNDDDHSHLRSWKILSEGI